MTYKQIQITPKGELAERLWLHCSEEASNGVRYILFGGNPQDLIRDALYFMGLIPKKQPKGCGDRSQWEPGQPVKISLWQENADALAKATKGMKKQEVIALALDAYIFKLDKTLK